MSSQAYISVDLIASVVLVAAINLLIVGGVEHYIWDIVVLSYLLFFYAKMVVECSLSVAEVRACESQVDMALSSD